MTFPTLDGETTIAAITYFYEPFLEAFDPQLREDLGVWYTPPEVVRYQVQRVHYLLKTELGRPRGLADPDVVDSSAPEADADLKQGWPSRCHLRKTIGPKSAAAVVATRH
jgi:hypothetical protein